MNPKLRVISLGAGVQSTALVLMAAHGEIGPMPDCAIFADTGWEPRAVYDHLAWLENVLPFPVHHVSNGNLRDDALHNQNTGQKQFASVPWFTVNPDGSKGMGRRQCTSEYKLTPIMRGLRTLLGVGRHGHIPKGTVEVWIGISTDEALRQKPPRQQWQTGRWPLLEQGLSRTDCAAWFLRHYERIAPKSACLGCPFHDDAAWADQRDNAPEEWADTLLVDAAIRAGPGKLRATQYMHRACKPLAEVNLKPASKGPNAFINECEGMCGL